MTIANSVSQLAPWFYSWQAYEPAAKCDLMSSAVVTGEGLILIDPIDLPPEAWQTLCPAHPPAAILITNGNHARSAAALRARFGCRVLAAAAAVPGLEITVDATVEDGDLAPGGFRVVGLPGAGPGEVAYVGQGIACIGDAVVDFPPDGFMLLPDKYCAAPRRLPEDVRKLLSLEFHILSLAHGPPILDQARARLSQLLP